MAAPNATFRRIVMTLGVTAITVSGAYLGANLSADRDKVKENKKALEADLGERIAQLEMRRTRLVKQRQELEKKLQEVKGRPTGHPDQQPWKSRRAGTFPRRDLNLTRIHCFATSNTSHESHSQECSTRTKASTSWAGQMYNANLVTVLTSRKYGVATVWLVATLGTASERRKVKRAEIEDVDVSRACQTITNTETPLALRLQSNLLFGVSRVYSQQCTFVLKDAEHVRLQVRLAMTALKAADTTTTSTKAAKAANITLQDDPEFVLDIELMPGLDLDYKPFNLSQESRLFSLEMDPRENSAMIPSPGFRELEPLSDGFSPAGAPFGLGSRKTSSPASSRFTPALRMSSHHSQQNYGISALLDDPGFAFDADGNIVDGPQEERENLARRTTSVAPSLSHENMRPIPQQEDPFNLLNDLQLPLDNDGELYPDARPLSIQERSDDTSVLSTHSQPHHPGTQQGDEAEEQAQEEASMQQAAASSRAHRHRRSLGLDEQMELRNSEYVSWDRNYAEMMATATKSRMAGRLPHIAKLNAHHWIQERGILGLSMQLNIPSTLRIFTGPALYAAFAERSGSPSTSSSKRSRSPTVGDDDDERRVRARLSSEAGRAELDLPRLDSDAPAYLGGDELDAPPQEDDSVEVGRRGETPLAEHRSSSRMPWNISASLRGSSVRGQRGPQSLLGARVSSLVSGDAARGGMSVGLPGSSVAASPLTGYPRDSTGGLVMDEETFQLALDDDQMEFDQPEQLQAGQVAHNESQLSWRSGASGASEKELENFYGFVVDALTEKRSGDIGSTSESGGTITFEALLPPTEHNKDTAAAGLMHVLALQGRGMLRVQQDKSTAFLPIHIDVV